MTVTTQSDTDLVRRVEDAVPVLRSHARWMDEHRCLHDEVLEALDASGILRMRIPARCGGLESDATTMYRAISQVGLGDGSAAWNCAAWSMGAWLTGMFPDEVQDEVFSTPNVRVCGTLSPSATATPRDSGVVINGEWHFVSGARHSQWQQVIAMAPTPDGLDHWPIMAVVPISDLEIVDDWHTSGLRGTGSVTTVARDVYVPAQRVMPLVTILQGHHASVANAGAPMYQSPMIVTGCATFVGTAAGLARAAQESFLERLPGRKITYTAYASQREAPLTHLQVAEAALKIDEVDFHATRLVTRVDTRAVSGQPWDLLDRAAARAALGRAFSVAKEAVDILNTASGGSSVYTDVPIQRIERDLQTLNLHALMHPNTNLELYGRVLCGLEPNTMYL